MSRISFLGNREMPRLAWFIGAVFLLVSCTYSGYFDTPSGRKAIAGCKVLTEDGENCAVWAEGVSKALTGDPEPAYLCCGRGNNPMCTLGAPVQLGSNCACFKYDNWGRSYPLGGIACNEDDY